MLHTIIIKDGTYTENVNVNKSLTIRSENGSDSTIINALDPQNNVFEVAADWVIIRELTIKGATGDKKSGIYLRGRSKVDTT